MTDPGPAGSDRKMRSLAREAAIHHFGSKPSRMTRLAGGLTNFVFHVSHPEGDFVIRLNSDPAKINTYLKEQWAIARAREAGVPASEVLEVGNQVGVPYAISRAVRGEPATDHPNRIALVEELGRILSRIHGIRTEGFGETFDWSANQLSRAETWKSYIPEHYQVEERLKLLAENRMIGRAVRKALAETFDKIARQRVQPVLNQGDPRLKNLLVDTKGDIASLIDWEFCLSTSPDWDLSLALHDLSIDQKQALLDGYGLTREEILDRSETWKAFNILNYVPFIEEALADGDEEKLEAYRTRLSGALDLYCL